MKGLFGGTAINVYAPRTPLLKPRIAWKGTFEGHTAARGRKAVRMKMNAACTGNISPESLTYEGDLFEIFSSTCIACVFKDPGEPAQGTRSQTWKPESNSDKGRAPSMFQG